MEVVLMTCHPHPLNSWTRPTNNTEGLLEVLMTLVSFPFKWAQPSPGQTTPTAEEVQEDKGVQEVNLHMAEGKEALVRILTANKQMWHILLERRCLKRRLITSSA
jgi:hypothetical protein